jgi:small GTP-binding protein
MIEFIDGMSTVKCVVLGDGGIGKTCLLLAYTSNSFSTEYVPTVFDNYAIDICVDGHLVKLLLWDTPGQEEYARLRALSYAAADVVLICFALNSMLSLENAREQWMAEVRGYLPKVPVVLAGLKSDLIEDLDRDVMKSRHNCVDKVMIKDACEAMKVAGYAECSALKGRNIRDVFETAVGAVLWRKEGDSTQINTGDQAESQREEAAETKTNGSVQAEHCCLLL